MTNAVTDFLPDRLAGDSTAQSVRPLTLLWQGWHWWRRELAQLVPDKFTDALRGPRVGVDVRVESGVLRFFPADGSEGSPLAELPFEDPQPLELETCRRALGSASAVAGGLTLFLPDQYCLTRTLALPLATEHNLDDVLRFELDRLTPFTPARAWFGYTPIRRVPEAGKLLVSLSVVPKASLKPILSVLDDLGVGVRALYPANKPLSATMNLYRQETSAATQGGSSGGAKGGLVVISALLVALLVYPAWQLEAIIDARTQDLAEIRPEAESLSRLESRLARDIDARNTLMAKKADSPTRLLLLRELTRLIPDNTWVRRLEISGDSLVVRGESRKAAELIALLEGSPLFADVTFISPVTRDADSGIETFELRMAIEGGGA